MENYIMIHKMKSNEEPFERINTDKLKENLDILQVQHLFLIKKEQNF